VTTLTIHQPTGTAGILHPLTARITAWRQRRTEARMVREVAAANRGRITIAEFLQRLGADEATIRRYSASFGKKVADAYRNATGAEPAKSGAAIVRGEIVPVYGYGWQHLELISRVAVQYAPVAALIGA
jgi:hypothetical protein